MFPRRWWRRGAVPSADPSSVRPEQRMGERRGLGGNATTHFTGKSGATQGAFHPGILLDSGVVVGCGFFFISFYFFVISIFFDNTCGSCGGELLLLLL